MSGISLDGIVSLDKYIGTLFEKKCVSGISILSTAPGINSRNVILAQRGNTLKKSEAVNLVEQIIKNDVKTRFITHSSNQYLITSIQERSYYGKAIDIEKGGGIVICKTTKSLVVAVYEKSWLPCEVIPQVEALAEIAPI